jgi:hypothetical protein
MPGRTPLTPAPEIGPSCGRPGGHLLCSPYSFELSITVPRAQAAARGGNSLKIVQLQWTLDAGWQRHPPADAAIAPHLILTFGSPSALTDAGALADIGRAFPGALHFGCSTAGEIQGTRVSDESLSVTAIRFDATTLADAYVRVASPDDSFLAGQYLATAIRGDGLRHAFVLSDGLSVNGSELVRGLYSKLPADVTVTGGLSGDGARFQRTYVLCHGAPETGIAGIIGFYGDALSVGYGSLGGWDPFGPERIITRSAGNVLYEVDGRSALALYKAYLGDHAAGLPATGLLFPLSLRTAAGETGVVRTILAVDEATQSMTFAGDVPEGAYARLMKANFDRLIDGAMGAARACTLDANGRGAELALLISCVGRKLLLGQRIEEEVEGVREVLGDGPAFTGFYSYGEISPFATNAKCELHNQTMTITTLSERAA